MSQPHNPTDTQALVQSMLQRLKLQPGSESQAYLHTPAAVTPVPTRRQDVENEASVDQRVNTSPLNDSGRNGIASQEFRTSSADTDDGLKGGEMNGDLISSNAQKHNIDGETGEIMGLSQATLPGTTPTGTGQLHPAKSLKDADTASFERTNGDRVSSGSSATTKDTSGDTDAAINMRQNPDLDQGVTPRVYVWSVKSTDTGVQENKLLHVGNGGSLAPTTENSSFRKKQRPPEKKTKRWTAKIKERWRDRQGSFGKKGKEAGGTVNHESAKEVEGLAPNQRLTSENPFKNDEEAIFSSVDNKGPSEPPGQTEDNTTDGHIRSAGDFEFGLGSFSLLEEITNGQEWAKFLNPNMFSASANQIPSQQMQVQLKNQPDSHSQAGALNQVNAGNSQWRFGSVQPSCVFSGTQVSPDGSLSMDVTQEKHADARVHTDADQSEPMEDSQDLSDSERKPLPSSAEPQPSENVRGLVTRNRIQLTRKRHHQSAEMLQPEKMSDGEEADQESSLISGQDMEETEESQLDNITPNPHPTTLSPSSLNPTFLPPRGVLKHSISRDSQTSMEILSKRRRVEENRHVHFSEEVVIIQAPEPDLDVTVSEEDSEEEEEEDEEDSVLEQELEVEHVVVEEVAPARRPVLPNWILALKRRNTGKKPR